MASDNTKKIFFPARFVSRPAFTLLELLLVVAILAVMASIGRAFFGSFAHESILEDNARSIVFDLRQARNNAMNGAKGSNWGINFVNDSDDYYEIFSSPSDYEDPDMLLESMQYLNGASFFASPEESSNLVILFDRVNGDATPDSIIIFTGRKQREISVSERGVIE